LRTGAAQLDGAAFDLCVVGAGIQGAAVARDAALRGLSVLLVDARDIAAGTSSRSSRLVHGGLRYLRQGRLGLVREALRERELLLRSCPHLVRPLPMLMPFFRDGGPARWPLRLGTWLYDRLARGSTLPGPRSLSAKATAAAFPGLRTQGLRSGLEFFDAVTQDTRLTVANVLGARAAGARVATWCEVTGLAPGGGLRLLDWIGGDECTVRAANIVNATGPAADRLRWTLQVPGDELVRLSRGSHVVLPPRAGERALAAFLPDGRIQFVVPHDGGTLCGTTEVDDLLPGDETGPPSADVDYLLAALAHLLAPPPARADLRFGYAGWRALPARSGPAGALGREAVVIDERLPGATLHTIVGGKLTTHRSLAERLVARVFGRAEPSPTRTQALPGGGGPREVTEPLWWRHGSRIGLVRALLREAPELARSLCPHRPFLAVELVHALQNDGAVTFADAMLRRLVHVAGPCPELACLREAHAVFLRARAWPVDDDADVAIRSLLHELLTLVGDIGR